MLSGAVRKLGGTVAARGRPAAKPSNSLQKKTTMAIRHQSTCTMDLITPEEEESNATSPMFSTLQYVSDHSRTTQLASTPSSMPQPPVSTPAAPTPPIVPQDEQNAMEIVLRDTPNPYIAADELTLTQVAERRQFYDKTILLVQHGEDFRQALLDHDSTNGVLFKNPMDQAAHEDDPESLTGRGIGQSLSLSRRMADFDYDHSDTPLNPELVVVAPLKQVLQTTSMVFPYHTPHYSVRSTPWICHPYTMDPMREDHTLVEATMNLQREFAGVDWSLLRNMSSSDQLANGANDSSSPTRSRPEQLLDRADGLLEWLNQRPERVVVVSGEAIWLNYLAGRLCSSSNAGASFGALLDNGELKAYGVHYLQ